MSLIPSRGPRCEEIFVSFLFTALQVLAELKSVFKADAGLELNVAKTSIFPKGVTAQAAFDMAQTIIQVTSSLDHLRNDFLVDSF